MHEPDDDEVAGELALARPTPPERLRVHLREWLLDQRPGRHRPEHLWPLATGALVAGFALLAVAAIYAL